MCSRSSGYLSHGVVSEASEIRDVKNLRSMRNYYRQAPVFRDTIAPACIWKDLDTKGTIPGRAIYESLAALLESVVVFLSRFDSFFKVVLRHMGRKQDTVPGEGICYRSTDKLPCTEGLLSIGCCAEHQPTGGPAHGRSRGSEPQPAGFCELPSARHGP